jgi:hypothetical protein
MSAMVRLVIIGSYGLSILGIFTETIPSKSKHAGYIR